MAFGIKSIREMAIDELNKVEAAIKNDVKFQHVEAAIEADLKVLEAFESRITPEEMAGALNILFPKKFDGKEIKVMEDALGRIISVAANPAALMDTIKEAVDPAKK